MLMWCIRFWPPVFYQVNCFSNNFSQLISYSSSVFFVFLLLGQDKSGSTLHLNYPFEQKDRFQWIGGQYNLHSRTIRVPQLRSRCVFEGFPYCCKKKKKKPGRRNILKRIRLSNWIVLVYSVLLVFLTLFLHQLFQVQWSRRCQKFNSKSNNLLIESRNPCSYI